MITKYKTHLAEDNIPKISTRKVKRTDVIQDILTVVGFPLLKW